MKRYKVKKINDTILHEMPFPDLLIRYTTGLTLMLKVKEGEYLPTEILEPSDLQRSLIVGSLGAYIKAGKIIVEDDEVKIKPEPQVSKPIPVSQPKPQEPHSVEEVQAPVQETQPQPQVEKVAAPKQNIQDLAQVKTVEDFSQLSYFLRTKFVASCTDKTLLTSIEKIADRQIKVSIKNRLAMLNK